MVSSYSFFTLPLPLGKEKNLDRFRSEIIRIAHSSVIVAEAMTLRNGLRQTIIGVQILLERHSKTLIDSLTCTIQISWQVKFLVKDILLPASNCSQFSFDHIWRKTDFVAV